MRTTLMVLVGCALLLLGAYFASRSLVSDVPTPVSAAASPEVVRPMAITDPAPNPKRMEEEAPIVGARQGPLTPGTAPFSPRLAQADAQPPVAEVAPSPFQGESKELDYAEALVAEPNLDLERLVSARTVLSRCVDQEPNNQRCLSALAVAQSRLGGRTGGARKPAAPTLQVPQLNRPASMPQ